LLAVCVLAGVVLIVITELPINPFILGVPVALSILLVGVAVLLFVFRHSSEARTFWLCDQGVVWRYGSRVGSCKWDYLSDIFVTVRGGRPAYAITLGDVDTVFSLSHSAHAIAFGEYMEKRASAGLFTRNLKKLLRGETVLINPIELNLRALRWQELVIDWDDLTAISSDGADLILDHKRSGKPIVIPGAQVSHRGVLLALGHVIIAEKLHDPGTPQPGANLSPYVL
jgi:hypothetical protein